MQPHLCHTTELRWFMPGGENDTAWLSWFMAGSSLPLCQDNESPPVSRLYVLAQAPRLDRYMIAPECDRNSIKQHQGVLDVKTQISSPQPFSQGDVSGSCDSWMKWTFTPRDEALKKAFVEDLLYSASWVDVEKQRYVVQAGWLDGVGPQPLSPDSPAIRCQYELTQINLPTVASGPNHWLTVAIELTACSEQADISMANACWHFLDPRGPPPSPLSSSMSQSYPVWLAMIVASAVVKA